MIATGPAPRGGQWEQRLIAVALSHSHVETLVQPKAGLTGQTRGTGELSQGISGRDTFRDLTISLSLRTERWKRSNALESTRKFHEFSSMILPLCEHRSDGAMDQNRSFTPASMGQRHLRGRNRPRRHRSHSESTTTPYRYLDSLSLYPSPLSLTTIPICNSTTTGRPKCVCVTWTGAQSDERENSSVIGAERKSLWTVSRPSVCFSPPMKIDKIDGYVESELTGDFSSPSGMEPLVGPSAPV